MNSTTELSSSPKSSGATGSGAAGAPTSRLPLPERLSHFLASNPARDIDGSGELTDIVMPFTGEVLTQFHTNLAHDVEAKMERARIAAAQWARVPVSERARIIGAIHHHIRRNEELLLDVIQAENGKNRLSAFDEVLDAYNMVRYVSLNAADAMRERTVTGAIPGLTKTRVVREPVGVVGFISPWNYPLSLGANDVLSTLAAGNAVVQKPDSKTPLSALLLRRFAIAAGLPADVWQLVPGEIAQVSAPLTRVVDGLSFTGSTAAGKQIAESVAGRLIPTALELGGKNPMVILPDADLDRAVDIALRGCFSSTGQLCLSIERIYVVDEQAEVGASAAGAQAGAGDQVTAGAGRRTREFIEKFTKATQALKLGAGFDYSYQVGTLTHPAQLDRVDTQVKDAVAHGAKVATGGKPRPDIGPWYFEPTILTWVEPGATLYKGETFGPVVSVYAVSSVEAAIEAANDTEYGLNACVVTGNAKAGWDVARQLQAGMVNINEAFAAVWGSIGAPSGGIKDSGLGHRHGIEGLTIFTQTRTLAEQPLIPIAPFQIPRTGKPILKVTPATFQKVMSLSLNAMRALRMK